MCCSENQSSFVSIVCGCITLIWWQRWHSQYRDSLQAGWASDWIPMEVRFSVPLQTSPKAHPVPCTMGTGSSLGIKQLKHDDNLPPPFSIEVANLNKPPPPLCACTCMSWGDLFIILLQSCFTQWICWPCVGIYCVSFFKQWIYLPPLFRIDFPRI